MTAPTTPPTLVLWDIDHTLVAMPGLAQQWYGRAVARVLGCEMRDFPSLGGRTERAITSDLLDLHGVARSEELIVAMFSALADAVAEEPAAILAQGQALPGADAALRALAGKSNVVQSLVTGNLEPVAMNKLEPFGLHTHLDFGIGAYGSLSAVRADLVAAAKQKAEAKHAVSFAAARIVVIGDTAHDVEAALHHGAFAIGVATGRVTEAELRAAGAHATLPDLADTASVLAAVLR